MDPLGGRFPVKLMKFKLQGPSLTWAPSKTLGRTLTPCSQSHIFVKSAKVCYFNYYPLRPPCWGRMLVVRPKGSLVGIAFSWPHEIFYVAHRNLCACLSHCLSTRCEDDFPEKSSRSQWPQRHRHNTRMDGIDKLVDESHQLEGI